MLHQHPNGQTELQVIDWRGVELWVGGPGSTRAIAQIRVGERGPHTAVHLDREAAIAVRDVLTRFVDGTAR